MIRVAFILSNLAEDGGQTVVCTLLKNLDKNKYLSKLFILSPEVDNKLCRHLRAAEVDFEFLNLKFDYKVIRSIDIFYRLNRGMNRFRPDVVNVHLDTLYSWIWAWVKRRRIIFTVHSEASRISNMFSLQLFKRLNRKNLIKVIGVSKFASLRFEEVFGANDVMTIYNPVDIECYDNYSKPQHENIRLINVARFYPVKNHRLLIDAFSLVCKEITNVQLYLVGDGQEYENIKKYVREKRVENKVIFTGYREDVAELLVQSDIFVMSSLSEAFPISVIEALAAGLPVVATKVGGLPELVSDNGILVETNNASQLCAAMLRLIRDERKRKQMGRISLKKSALFSISNVLSQYGRLYDEEAERKKEIYYYN